MYYFFAAEHTENTSSSCLPFCHDIKRCMPVNAREEAHSLNVVCDCENTACDNILLYVSYGSMMDSTQPVQICHAYVNT